MSSKIGRVSTVNIPAIVRNSEIKGIKVSLKNLIFKLELFPEKFFMIDIFTLFVDISLKIFTYLSECFVFI